MSISFDENQMPKSLSALNDFIAMYRAKRINKAEMRQVLVRFLELAPAIEVDAVIARIEY